MTKPKTFIAHGSQLGELMLLASVLSDHVLQMENMCLRLKNISRRMESIREEIRLDTECRRRIDSRVAKAKAGRKRRVK